MVSKVGMVSKAETRLLKRDKGLSRNYRRLLSVRLSNRVSRAMVLVGDPRLAFYRNCGYLEALARELASDRIFREAFLATLQGTDGSIPIL
ncbi:unnamed protein product [marine sediment metagenome]|uniref:Uncharacterized protein n=1 Tax=marine sediment metagenome TaxID=412755 RepID=X1KRY2_9ZZZZ